MTAKICIKSIGVFCGANVGISPTYKEAAQDLGMALARASIGLVYGGARVGLMGLIADQMLADNAQVIGVIPQLLLDKELAHSGLTKLHIVTSMHERKVLIAELSDAFIMLPGGAGSLDEFFEMMTLGQLGFHTKPCAILNVDGYYNSLITFLDHAVDQGFLAKAHRDMIIVAESPQEILDYFYQYQAPLDHWGLNSLARTA